MILTNVLWSQIFTKTILIRMILDCYQTSDGYLRVSVHFVDRNGNLKCMRLCTINKAVYEVVFEPRIYVWSRVFAKEPCVKSCMSQGAMYAVAYETSSHLFMKSCMSQEQYKKSCMSQGAKYEVVHEPPAMYEVVYEPRSQVWRRGWAKQPCMQSCISQGAMYEGVYDQSSHVWRRVWAKEPCMYSCTVWSHACIWVCRRVHMKPCIKPCMHPCI